jgi:hypothetical protein
MNNFLTSGRLNDVDYFLKKINKRKYPVILKETENEVETQ